MTKTGSQFGADKEKWVNWAVCFVFSFNKLNKKGKDRIAKITLKKRIKSKASVCCYQDLFYSYK